MKRVSDFIRINTTPNPDYPSGQIKDATDKYTEDGTVINQNFIQDWYNFFQKCVRDSGIVPNGDFDTASNAQLFDAVMGTPKIPITSYFNGVSGSLIADRNALRVWKENGGRILRLEGWTQGGTVGINGAIFELPVGFRPKKDIYVHAMGDDNDMPSGTIKIYGVIGIAETVVKISGTLNDMAHYYNASIPLD